MKINETTVNNIPIIDIRTDKFKTFTIRISFRNTLDEKTTTIRNILSRMMIKRTKNLRTETELVQHLAKYYGAHLTEGTTKRGDSHIVNFTLEFANERFIHEDLNIFNDLCEFLNDILTTPFEYTDEWQSFLDQEKRLHKNKLSLLMDSSMQRAYINMLNIMFKDEPNRHMSFGKIDEIDSITLEDIMKEHKKMMEEDEMAVLVVGQTTDNNIKSLEKIYSRDTYVKLPFNGFSGQVSNVINYQTDVEKIEQAKIILGFRIDKKQADMMSARIFNRMFGGGAASFLFMNLREKLSLAYQIHSELDIKNGVLFAIAGVDFNRVKETEIHVMKELEKIRNGEFTEEFLQESKNQFLSARLDSMDKPKGVIATLYGHFLAGIDFDYVDEQLSLVTKESVMNVAKHTHLDTVYTLTGDEPNGSHTL